MKPIDALRDRLVDFGAVQVRFETDGAFALRVLRLGELRFELTTEYDKGFASLAIGDGPLSPAADWLAALAGEDEMRKVDGNDPARLADALPELLTRAVDLQPAVQAFRLEYERLMRARLSRRGDSSVES